MSKTTDISLVAQVAVFGNKRAFDELVRRYQSPVRRFFLNQTLGDSQLSDDLAQDTFIKVWQSIGSYDNRYSFSTWVYTICSRLCLDRIKKLRWQAPMADDIGVLENYVSDSNPERQLEGSEWVSVVKVLVQGLSNKQRLVFTLSQLEGLSTEEITEITGMDATQIKSNLSLARKSVREQLKKLGYE